MKNKILIIAIVSIVLSVAGLSWLAISEHNRVRFGFVNTEKLLTSFVESQKSMQEVRDEDAKWRKSYAIIDDSLKAFEQRMATVYDAAPLAEKKALKDEQVRRIEEMGRFEKAQAQKIQTMQTQKLQAIYDKINSAMTDFAKQEGLDLIFASSNGSIVYGDGTDADLTDAFSQFLNARFK